MINKDTEAKLCEKYCINQKYSSLEELCGKRNIELIENASLSEYTSFEIGGKCDFLVKPDSSGSLRDVILYCRENDIKYYILGRGSNVLISDIGLKGVVIVLSTPFSQIIPTEDGIYCEAGAEPYAGQLAVGAVVINRVLSSVYPDTVTGVIYQNKQFSPVASGRLALALAENRATPACYKAADEAMSGQTNVGNCVYFRTPIEGLSGISIGGHIFY